MKFINFNANDTMKLASKQQLREALQTNFANDILEALGDTSDLYGIILIAIQLGVIQGKRLERARRKKH